MKTSSKVDSIGIESAESVDLQGKVNKANFHSVLTSLSKNPNLKTLDLSNNKLGDQRIRKVIDVITKLPIEVLNLNGNNLSPISLIYLQEVISESKTLKVLTLANNQLGEHTKKSYCFANFAKVLNTCSNLVELDLSNNCFISGRFHNIAEELEKNKSIEILKIGRNNFDTFGAKLIANILKKNEKLAYLSIACNSDPLYKAPTLYQKCKINVMPILEALQNKCSLKELDLSEIELNDNEENSLKVVRNSCPYLVVKYKNNVKSALESNAVGSEKKKDEELMLRTFAKVLLSSPDSSQIIRENPGICKYLGELGAVIENERTSAAGYGREKLGRIMIPGRPKAKS